MAGLKDTMSSMTKPFPLGDVMKPMGFAQLAYDRIRGKDKKKPAPTPTIASSGGTLGGLLD
jgi:hypothetical protein